MQIYDISLPISESLVVWPGDPTVRITKQTRVDHGEVVTVTSLDMGAHIGTHVDAPAHFIPGGTGVEAFDLNVLVGPALVVHATESDILSADVLEKLEIPPGTERVLFRTRNSERWAGGYGEFYRDFVAVTEGGAHWLIERGVRLVGMDYLSVATFYESVSTHKVLLKAGVILVEGLDLRSIEPGFYQLFCLPLKIVGSDGAPARVILIDEGEK